MKKYELKNDRGALDRCETEARQDETIKVFVEPRGGGEGGRGQRRVQIVTVRDRPDTRPQIWLFNRVGED